MTSRKTFLQIVVLLVLLQACREPEHKEEINYVGYAQGTSFQIKYLVNKEIDYQLSIDSLFSAVDQSVSSYDPNSLVSKVNQGNRAVSVDDIFLTVLEKAQDISNESNGYFDITVGPLTELWGFGLSKKHLLDSVKVDSALALIGFDSIAINKDTVEIPEGFKIDFNSIAQGYTVDLIALFLEGKGITNYMVEVGGEVRARGVNSKEKVWKIGVDKPLEDLDLADRFQMIINLKDASLASSGNYRKFWVDKETGTKYSHTIDPKTGYPSRNRLLGVSLIASNAMDADAYATLCMVMGLNKSIDFLRSKPNLEGYLIYTEENGEWGIYQTPGFKDYIID